MSSMSPVVHPLAPPALSGNNITVDTMLNQPTRITRMLMDLTKQRFIIDRVFSSAGGVTGGAVVYDQQTQNELYTKRDVERVAPGSEFPIITSERLAPKVAEVEKWGGVVFITDEARTRNNSAAFTNQVRQLANTIVRKLNQRAIAELEASISATSQSFTGVNWGTAILEGSSATAPGSRPTRDFAHAQRLADEDELGVTIDTWLVNPQEYEALVMVYGDKLADVLASSGIKELYSSNRITAGTAYALASGMVGEMRLEQPLATETWREERTERNFIKSSVRPVMYVTNPYAVFKVTGLAG